MVLTEEELKTKEIMKMAFFEALCMARTAEPMLSKGELAKAFAVDTRTVDRWAKQRGFPKHGKKGKPLYYLSEVQEWLK